MRYFSLKANCSICNKKLDLLTCRARFQLKDGWLCKRCRKKVDINKLKFNKTTVEEYKTLANFVQKPTKKCIHTNVTGVTFENEENKDIQTTLKNIVKIGLNNGDFIPYWNLTGKELKEELMLNQTIGEVDGQELPYTIILEKNKYNNQKFIKVYIVDDNNISTHIGYINSKEVNKVLNFIDNYDYTVTAYIIGGKYKALEYDEYDDNVSTTIIEELNYGIELTLIEK